MLQVTSRSRYFATSSTQRDVIHAHGHDGSNQNSTCVAVVCVVAVAAMPRAYVGAHRKASVATSRQVTVQIGAWHSLTVGYAAMLEQFHPTEVVELSAYAETKGFSGVMAADHFQPWVPQQGQSAFVWNVLAALGERTKGDLGPGRHGADVPLASGDGRPGVGDARRDVSGTPLARPRVGRSAQRAHHRRVLAGSARAHQPDVRGHRRHQEAVLGIHRGKRHQALRAVLQARVDPALDDAEGCAGDPGCDRRARDGKARGQDRRRPDHRRRSAREDRWAVHAVRRGCPRGGQRPVEDAEGAATAHELGGDR